MTQTAKPISQASLVLHLNLRLTMDLKWLNNGQVKCHVWLVCNLGLEQLGPHLKALFLKLKADRPQCKTIHLSPMITDTHSLASESLTCPKLDRYLIQHTDGQADG